MELKRFIGKSLRFCWPFLLIWAGVLVIDPYDFFWKEPFVQNNEKTTVAYELNYALFKYLRFAEQPVERVVFGDSRMESLRPEQFQKITGKPYFNFAIGGGTVPEMVESFWYASRHSQLKEVTFGLNFGRYNAFNNENRCREAQELLDHPYRYFIYPSTLKASYYILKHAFSGEANLFFKPEADREAFWKHQLEFLAATFYRDYAYPDSYYQALQQIVQYCKQEGIAFQFVILPTHVELQNQIAHFGQEAAFERYLSDLESLGVPIHNFHQADSLTLDKNLYKDPFHFKPAVGDIVIKQVFGGK